MEKAELHPRNRHRKGYDFARLVKAAPELGPFLIRARHGGTSLDFSDPAAVKALNRALLLAEYGVRGWAIPDGYLCPPIPGRADYVHYAADLLDGARGKAIRVLDLGTGANLVYPLLGHAEYGWSFVGTDIDANAIQAARSILAANPSFQAAIEVRLQRDRKALLEGILNPGDRFDLVMCNPPFFASAAEARAVGQDKWRKLGKEAASGRNFGGRGAELWCEGGEVAFIRCLIEESAARPTASRWFTSLVSKSANLPAIHRALRHAEAKDIRTLEMAQGQKKSRFVAWRMVE